MRWLLAALGGTFIWTILAAIAPSKGSSGLVPGFTNPIGLSCDECKVVNLWWRGLSQSQKTWMWSWHFTATNYCKAAHPDCV